MAGAALAIPSCSFRETIGTDVGSVLWMKDDRRERKWINVNNVVQKEDGAERRSRSQGKIRGYIV